MTSALDRLRALRAGNQADVASIPAILSADDLPADWRIEFEERAAIREYDGNQPREDAEREALKEILARMQAQNTR